MRLPIALVLALALPATGCVTFWNETPVESASVTPPTTTTAPRTSAPPPTPQPTGPAPTTQPTPTPATAPTPTTSPPPVAPPKPADTHVEQSGWANATPGETHDVAKVPFFVLAGAQTVTATFEFALIVPNVGAAPVSPANFTLLLRDPEGQVLDFATFVGLTDAKVTLDLNVTQLARAGEYLLEARMLGASDGASAGGRYHAMVDVRY